MDSIGIIRSAYHFGHPSIDGVAQVCCLLFSVYVCACVVFGMSVGVELGVGCVCSEHK